MNLVELDQALRKLRLSGMANVLETRLLQAQTEQLAPIDLLAALVSDELQRREDRLLARRHKQARFRDPDRSLDGFDFDFNKKICGSRTARWWLPKPWDVRSPPTNARRGPHPGLEQAPRDPQVVPGHGAEQILVARGQVPGPCHVAFDPGRVEGPAREQLPQRTPAPAHGRGIDARRGHMSAETQHQRVRDRMVPARMGRQQSRLGDHVAVEKHQDVVRRRPRPGIARPRQAEAAPLLAHQLHVERNGARHGPLGNPNRRLRAVVDDHDLEQPRAARPAAPAQPGSAPAHRAPRSRAR